MIHFCDSSAVVKLYADEPKHETMRSVDEPHIVSELARVEVPAALWRKNRLGGLGDDDTAVLIAAFEADWERPEPARRFIAIAATGAIVDHAARLAGAHGLRAYDAVQLATAIAARRAVPECATFVGFDRALNRAASTHSFAIAGGSASG